MFKDKQCKRCGVVFTPQSGTAKYCVECRSEAKKENDRRTHKYLHKQRTGWDHNVSECVLCGKEFVQKQKRSKFCSNECKIKNMHIKQGCVYQAVIGEVKKCKWCGNEFTIDNYHDNNKQYCSRSCLQFYKYYKKSKVEVDKEREEVERAKKEKELKKSIERYKQEKLIKKERFKKEQIKLDKIQYNEFKVCPTCNQVFSTIYKDKIYCSAECQRKMQFIKNGRPTGKKINKRVKSANKIVDKDITVKKLYKRDNGICWICGEKTDLNDFYTTDKAVICGDMYPSVDHIFPLSKGGEHSWNNVKLAHRRCNYIKNDTVYDDTVPDDKSVITTTTNL